MTTPPTTVGTPPRRETSLLATALGVGASLFIFVTLIGIMYYFTAVHGQPAHTRDQERREKLDAQRGADGQLLTTYGWTDKAKGTVRIPVERAMDLVVREAGK